MTTSTRLVVNYDLMACDLRGLLITNQQIVHRNANLTFHFNVKNQCIAITSRYCASYQSPFFLTNSINTRVLAERMLNVSMHVSITMQKVRQMVFFVKLHRLSDFLACCNAAKKPAKIAKCKEVVDKRKSNDQHSCYLSSFFVYFCSLIAVFSFLILVNEN